MKKRNLGTALLLSLAMVTGGVYGAWTYYEKEATGDSLTVNPTITITPTLEAKGAITLTNNTLAISVEPANSEVKSLDYHTTLSVTGSIDANYKPKDTNAAAFKGIEVTITFENGNTYNDGAIFTTTSLNTTEETLKINDSNLNLGINNILLATKAEAEAFKTALENTSIKITVSEKA